MSPKQLEVFTEIRRVLAAAYEEAFREDECHKTADGRCEALYPGVGDDEGCGGIEATGLMIYSYVLGPSRSHYFYKGRGRGNYATFYSDDPFARALREVRKWRRELATVE